MDILAADRTLVMGVLNVTPDSFSDGGDHFETDAAIEHGLLLMAEGADIVDVGGESTRPGAPRVDEAEELRRVVPVVEALADAGVTLSVDTMRSAVAEAAIAAGASMINDVSGGLADQRMLATAAKSGVPYIVMHWRGQSSAMATLAHYDDLMGEVCGEIAERIDRALRAGVPRELIIVDPGIGFSKTVDQNWTLLRHLDRIVDLGYPVLVGVSRKRFLGDLLAEGTVDRPPTGRDDATAALTTIFAMEDIWAVRTHAVRANRDVIAVVERLKAES